MPYRVQFWADPARLVVDFRTVAFDRLGPQDFAGASGILGHRFGRAEGDWSRIVFDLAGPMALDQAGMVTDDSDGSATITIDLRPSDMDQFRAGAVSLTPLADVRDASFRDGFVVALDPGHGGRDAGATGQGLAEADLVLALARDLRDALRRSGAAGAVLTRTDDGFVSLEGRIAVAKAAGADIFVSLHADGVGQPLAKGARVLTLSARASSQATAQLTERHDRGDLLNGVDLARQDDHVARVLMSMARSETQPRAQALAGALVEGLGQAGLRLQRRPQESSQLSILKAADMPSVLVDLGGGPRDDGQAQTWRRQAAEGIAQALLTWRAGDEARASVLRR